MRINPSAPAAAGAGPEGSSSSKLRPVIFRLPASLLSQIDAYGGNRFIHRSERMRALLAAGLKSES